MSCPAGDLLIIGYGNPLRGDDAAGPEAARRLAASGFQTITAHQLTPELAEPIAAAHDVYFLDADAGLAPGEISVTSISEAGGGPLEHHATPVALLRLAQEVYGAAPKAWSVGMGGSNFEVCDELSPAAEIAIDKAVITLCMNRD